MSLKVALDKLKNDTRMIDINLKSGALTPDELKKTQDKMPDLASEALELDLDNASDDSEE